MRKLFLILAVLILLPIHVSWGQAEAPNDPPYAIVTMAAGGASSGFGEWSGGFLSGCEFSVAKGGDVTLRVAYGQFNWRPDSPLRILQPTTLLKFDVGKKWEVYLVTGGDLYVDGQNTGAAFLGGFGGSRTILTYQNEKGNFGYFDLAGEMTITGAGDKSTGSYWQLKLGAVFRPAI